MTDSNQVRNANMPTLALAVGGVLIMKWEGFVPVPYGNPTTIGYGTTEIDGKPVPLNHPPIDKAQGFAWAYQHILDDYKVLLSHSHTAELPADPFMIGALLSFAYNLGVGNAIDVLKRIKINKTMGALDMANYCRQDGRFVQGLLNRRISEIYTLIDHAFNFSLTPDVTNVTGDPLMLAKKFNVPTSQVV